jgi:hypothetical protein
MAVWFAVILLPSFIYIFKAKSIYNHNNIQPFLTKRTQSMKYISFGILALVSTVRTQSIVSLSKGPTWRNATILQAGQKSLESFSFTTSDMATLEVTDYQCAGDSFEVYNNDVLFFSTNTVPNDNCLNPQPDIEAAWANPAFSKGSRLLEPGTYSFSIRMSSFAYTQGKVGIRVGNQVQASTSDECFHVTG